MFQMGSQDPFEYLKHKLWQKKKPKSKFDSYPLKIKNCLEVRACKWHDTYL